jgi:hypothetical protein
MTQISFHIPAEMRKDESKHKIYCNMLEAFFMFITPVFDEGHRPAENSPKAKWCPPSVSDNVRKLR